MWSLVGEKITVSPFPGALTYREWRTAAQPTAFTTGGRRRRRVRRPRQVWAHRQWHFPPCPCPVSLVDAPKPEGHAPGALQPRGLPQQPQPGAGQLHPDHGGQTGRERALHTAAAGRPRGEWFSRLCPPPSRAGAPSAGCSQIRHALPPLR